MVFFSLLIFAAACCVCCTSIYEEPLDEQLGHVFDTDEGSEETQALTIPMYSMSGEVRDEVFVPIAASEHASAWVSAHAIDESTAEALLETFETTILPALPVPTAMGENKLAILISYMEGNVYGYTPYELQAQAPTVCLNALYPEDLAYALAHEYQHLCVYEACHAGGTAMGEKADESLSDMFCERLFPGRGRERGILSEERALAAQEHLATWGQDVLPHVYDLLRAGYSQTEIWSILENG